MSDGSYCPYCQRSPCECVAASRMILGLQADLLKEHREEAARLKALFGKLRDTLAKHVARDDEPCRYDHHQFCQTHYCGRPCLFEVSKKLLENISTLTEDQK